MSHSSINQKGMLDFNTFPKWYTFIWNAKALLKNQIMSFFLHPHLLYFFPKPLEYDFIKNKISFIILINVNSFMKKIQDFSINSTKFCDLSY
jgi:hypothetical protein